MPEMNIIIWKIENGVLEEIMVPELDNQIFVPKGKIDFSPTKEKQKAAKDKGYPIKISKKRHIYKNILTDCQAAVKQGQTSFVKILQAYYPHLEESTIRRYEYNYRWYLGLPYKRRETKR